jgi:hypothetical protein
MLDSIPTQTDVEKQCEAKQGQTTKRAPKQKRKLLLT